MAYAFRIHDQKRPNDPAPMAATTMQGWTQTSHIEGNLLGNIDISLATNKMGTSIPSLFARILLFDVAYQTLKGKNFADMTATNSDTALVSESLDLMEFLYQHGQDPKLVVKRWNAATQIYNLQNDGYPEHRRLAKVLQDEITLRPELGDIYLFFWKDSTPSSLQPKEFLIGGTSPYTLVFTSPNWKRTMVANNFSFNRLDGSPLFDSSNLRPLNLRDGAFKDLLYSVRMAYQLELNQQAPSLNYYLTTMSNNDNPGPDVAGMGGTAGKATFLGKYTPIKDKNEAQVTSGIIPLCYEAVIETNSDYEMIPTSDRYAKYISANGTPVEIHEPPLVLNENGLPGARYIGTSVWDNHSCKINEAAIRNQELHDRVAPGAMGIKKPFVIWSDFLEDKIIKLPYKLNSEKFETAFSGDTQFLLPLKRKFFKFFNIEDITKEFSGKKLVEVVLKDNEVTVIINVPVRDATHHVVELKHTYSGENIVQEEVLLGFFPFYRCEIEKLNRYSVMTIGADIRLGFVKQERLDSSLSVKSMVRTTKTSVIRQTEYTTVTESFDFVEVTAKGVSGLIIPKMTLINTSQPTNEYKFGVDFGTSNTYIAHVTQIDRKPVTLEVDAHDQQTVFLYKPGEGNVMFIKLMTPFMNREFAPVSLGGNGPFAYPSRTAVCETPNFEKSRSELFGNISIGFNMMTEVTAGNVFAYKTRLKWLLEEHPGDPHHTDRVKYYFLQTLWMLKNESLLNGGDDQFEVYITFPETMKQPTKQALVSLWKWAKDELHLNCTFYHDPRFSESVAPYYCLAHLIQGASFLNVDIGGGTTDLLFVNKENGRVKNACYSSAMFAGDDLWGDGVSVHTGANHQNNGFTDFILAEIDANASTYGAEVLGHLGALRNGVSTSSADVMGYLFKHDQTFQTSAKIMGNRNLYALIFVHYAALMYNIARLIKKQGIGIPEKLSFTGMGSKYISLISSEKGVIAQLSKLLLEKFTGQNVPVGFEIISDDDVDVKEITAKGVLEGLDIKGPFKIPEAALAPIVDYGFDAKTDLTYADVIKPDVCKAALAEFDTFVDSLKERDFTNFLFSKFQLTISGQLLDDMKQKGRQSFTTMSASVPAQYSELNVTETLFFWPLKNTLVELSKNYKVYK